MHNAVNTFIKDIKKDYPGKFRFFKHVLECGSANINGSPREHFFLCHYTGIDIWQAKGVDIVCETHNFIRPMWYDVVISTEALEHDSYFEQSLLRMYKNLRSRGLLIITCAAPEREEHGTKRTSPESSPATTDYYKNISMEEFKSILPRHYFSTYVLQYARGMNDLQFYGIKK